MRYAIIGWGSLIWDNDVYFDKYCSDWKHDGPKLPIEFSRISSSRNGALTLVIDDAGGINKTYYCVSCRNNPEDAFADLRCREKTNNKNIGMINNETGKIHTNKDKNSPIIKVIKDWSIEKNINVVFWTDLEPNFQSKYTKKFSVNAAVEYLKNNFNEKHLKSAVEYIERCGTRIKTTPLLEHLRGDPWYSQKLRLYNK